MQQMNDTIAANLIGADSRYPTNDEINSMNVEQLRELLMQYRDSLVAADKLKKKCADPTITEFESAEKRDFYQPLCDRFPGVNIIQSCRVVYIPLATDGAVVPAGFSFSIAVEFHYTWYYIGVMCSNADGVYRDMVLECTGAKSMYEQVGKMLETPRGFIETCYQNLIKNNGGPRKWWLPD
jgi:hypothetical protein